MGVSGPVGLGQLYVDSIQQLCSDPSLINDQISVAGTQRLIKRAVQNDFMDALNTVKQVYLPVVGPNAINQVNTHSLIALPVGPSQTPTLFQMDMSGTVEAATPDLPTVAAGSGQAIADPFLTFLRRIFWHDQPPTVSSGIFAVTWTLHQAIEVSPGGLSGPIEIAVVDAGGARMLPEGEVDYHLQTVAEYEKQMKAMREPQGTNAQMPLLDAVVLH